MTTDRDDGERHERIKARAYAIWEQQGRPEGKGLENWLRAKRLVDAEDLRAVARWLTAQQAPLSANHGEWRRSDGGGSATHSIASASSIGKKQP